MYYTYVINMYLYIITKFSPYLIYAFVSHCFHNLVVLFNYYLIFKILLGIRGWMREYLCSSRLVYIPFYFFILHYLKLNCSHQLIIHMCQGFFHHCSYFTNLYSPGSWLFKNHGLISATVQCLVISRNSSECFESSVITYFLLLVWTTWYLASGLSV